MAVLLESVGLHRRWLRCLRVVFIGTTFNTVLPSSIGGDVVRAVMIAEAPEERIAAASAVVLQRLCNFPGMVALLIVSLMLTLGDSAATRVRPVGAAAAVAGTALILVCASPLLGSLARRHLLSLHRVGRAVSKLLTALDAFRGRRRELIGAWLRGSVFWIDVVINQYALMRAIGIHTSIPLAALVIITVTAVTFLPLSINGLGIREGGFATFLTVGGAATVTQGVAVGLLVSAQTLVLALIGLACIWTPGRGLRAAPPTLEGLDGIAS
jgi:glycosyltransferase 2 family protein